MVGRDNTLRELTALLKKERFVSIVGAGGIGKTTIALTLAHRMLAEFQGAVYFLDLGVVEDSRLLESLLASRLGLAAVSEQPLPIILTYLRDQRVLLVFDSCEHLNRGRRRTGRENIPRRIAGSHFGHEPGGTAGRRRAGAPFTTPLRARPTKSH